jgi:Spy/CpxP family protein refolding chaperone
MKNASKQIAVLLAVAMGLVFCGISYAQMEEKEAQAYKKKAEEVFNKLGLSAQQEAQVKEARKLNREMAKKLSQELQEKRKALAAELDKIKPDPQKIKVLVYALKDVQGRLIEQRVEGILKLKEILSPEQYRTFSDTLKGMRQERNKGERKGWKQ